MKTLLRRSIEGRARLKAQAIVHGSIVVKGSLIVGYLNIQEILDPELSGYQRTLMLHDQKPLTCFY